MTDQVVQDIKDRIDLVELVGSYIQLKRSGTNFKAVCPFHNEKTASLMVSPQKQIWHCFGCSEGGDAFGFVMRYENVEFRDALKLLADRAGIVLPKFASQTPFGSADTSLLVRVNEFAAKLYNRILLSADSARHALSYVRERGLNDETIKNWQIGFAPDAFHTLESALSKRGVATKDLIAAGVSIKNDSGKIYDRFRNRITFPIYSYVGDIVGFSARTLENNSEVAKYINSPETAIYNKSRILFGLNFAKSAIRKLDACVVVEGQMDCISAQQSGFTNTVATSGTALTVQHLQQLKRLTSNLIFCFDADAAGNQAARRAGELAVGLGLSVKLASIVGAKDPDELIKKSPGLWEATLAQAVWLVDFYIHYAHASFKAGSIEQKKYVSESVISLVGLISNPLERDHYVKKISENFGITEQNIRENFTTAQEKHAVPIIQSLSATVFGLEKTVLGWLLTDANAREFVFKHLKPDEVKLPELQAILNTSASPAEFLPEIAKNSVAKEAQFMLESQLENESSDFLYRQFEKAVYTLKLANIREQQEILSAQLRSAEARADTQQLQQVQKKLAALLNIRASYELK